MRIIQMDPAYNDLEIMTHIPIWPQVGEFQADSHRVYTQLEGRYFQLYIDRTMLILQELHFDRRLRNYDLTPLVVETLVWQDLATMRARRADTIAHLPELIMESVL